MASMDGGGEPQNIQYNYRFRNDDGDVDNDGVTGGQEAGASWKAAINTNISLPINGPKFRLRFGIRWDGNQDSGILNYNTAYDLDGDEVWSYIDRKKGSTNNAKVHTVFADTVNEMEHQRDTVETYADAEKLWNFGSDAWLIGAQTSGGCIASHTAAGVDGGRTGAIIWESTNATEGWAIELCCKLNPDKLIGNVGEDLRIRCERFPGVALAGFVTPSVDPYFSSASTHATITLLAADPLYDDYLTVQNRRQVQSRILAR